MTCSISSFSVTKKKPQNPVLDEENALWGQENIISLVRANKKKVTVLLWVTNSNSGPNMAAIKTRTCPPACLYWRWRSNHSFSLWAWPQHKGLISYFSRYGNPRLKTQNRYPRWLQIISVSMFGMVVRQSYLWKWNVLCNPCIYRCT